MKRMILAVLAVAPLFAQAPPPPPPMLPPPELDHLVSRIALYPDPLLAQILAAATYSNDIPDAAGWSDQHHYLTGQALADAIAADQLPWDPSVQALLPFPSVLDMMASDMNWTTRLGDAFMAQQQDVMDAVQTSPSGPGIRILANQRIRGGERRALYRDHSSQPWIHLRALVRSCGGLYRASARILCRRRDSFRFWHKHWRCVPALGLGL